MAVHISEEELNGRAGKRAEGLQEAVEQVIVFTLGEQDFGVHVLDSREIITLEELTPIPEAPDFVEGVIDLRGEIVPIIDLIKRLKLPGSFKGESKKVIIVSADGALLGIKVDEVREIVRIAADNVAEAPEITKKMNRDYIDGVARLNERLLVIINLNQIFSREEVNNFKELS